MMDELREVQVVLSEPRKGRKKIADKSTWKREKAKTERHKPKTLPKIASCRHGFKKRVLCCTSLKMQDVSRFHRHFYSHSKKIDQDAFLLKYCVAKTPTRKGVRKNISAKKQQTICYFIPKYDTTPRTRRMELVRVCRNAFIAALGVSKDRIQRVCKNHSATMTMPRENRGGDRRSAKYASQKATVTQYILNLKTLESHYVRGRSKVQYLSSDLSIRKLWKSYNMEHSDLTVKYEYFRRIFTTDFNLSFKCPATDACSKCIELKGLIESEGDQRKKCLLMAELRVHKLRAKWFYKNLASEKENEITFSFDCQKNLPVPKLPDQATYFSRQLFVYNFTICQGTSRDPQKPANTFIYTWLESEAPRGSNQISSAVYHRLTNTAFSENISHVRLMCDGCGGQNKNSIILGMLAYWLKADAPGHINKVTVFYPVVGHSFIPPDRIFGNIERQIKRQEIVVTPDEYFQTFSSFGTVLRLGQNFDFYDWKTAARQALKLPGNWHFQFAKSKRLFLRKDLNNRIAIKGEANYVAETCNYGNICKRNKTFDSYTPTKLNVGAEVDAAKLRDVGKLLKKHFGEEWQNLPCLEFFSSLFNPDRLTVRGSETRDGEDTDNEDTLMEEVRELRV